MTPEELARRLGQPPPTAEQSAAIASEPAPGVIVAGAGSGKTETMASRVVWLVAEGLVRPDQVLGLTFTRKAARELATRIRRRLSRLAAEGVVSESELLAGEPTVSTYDAYAGRIVAEHALRLGREPGTQLITEAIAWQYAQRVVASYDGPMEDVKYAPSTVVSKLLDLHNDLSGHLVAPERVVSIARELRERVSALPKARGQRTKTLMYADVLKALSTQDARAALTPLVEEFRRRKLDDGVMDFADQAELAATLARDFPEVGNAERQAYRVVLLDEYQDTSHAQLVLLRSLFGDGHAVTAVGDPCQSIYGWRGASAGTLTSFRRQFAREDGEPATLQALRMSFRNGPEILQVANRLSTPLRDRGLDVPELTSAPDASHATVVASLHRTADDEATDIARRAREFWDNSEPGRTVAVLVRARTLIPRIDAALRAVDLPVEVVGVGGLLETAEVIDVVATLRVMNDPARGDALMRLMTGARWRIGPRDLDALARIARQSSKDRHGGEHLAAFSLEDTDEHSIVDALDDISSADAAQFSPEGWRRLNALSGQLRALRERTAVSLPDLVHDVIRTLGLDVEVLARRGPTGRANLDRFIEVAADFESGGQTPTLTAFLAYLDAAETAERGLEPGEVEVHGDRVQVLTVHGSKGLEWDAVFVAGLVDKVFPAGGDRDWSWLGDPGELPYPLRGDASSLPHCTFDAASDQQQARDAVTTFREDAAEVARLEERRLAYVAVTRARRMLSCSGYRWDEAVRPRGVSEFLQEIAQVCGDGAGEVSIWVDDPGETNPTTEHTATFAWPYDPLGARRGSVESGAVLVKEMKEQLTSGVQPLPWTEWDNEVDRLLAERERLTSRTSVDVELPEHMSVSQLVRLRRSPQELAWSLARPMPSQPAPRARLGTQLHAWLESRWKSPRLLDIDDFAGSGDDDSELGARSRALREAFLTSQWADRTPLEVEALFELMVEGVALRGRVDAVFKTSDGIEVVDWKTGRVPSDEEMAFLSVQLAAYRLAFAELRGLPLDRVGAAFHYVPNNVTLRPADLLDEDELRALITSIPTPD